MRRRARPALVAACAAGVALTGCGGPADDAAVALPTVADGILTACVVPTPRLVVAGDAGMEGFDVEVLRAVAASVELPLDLVEVSYDELVSGVALNGRRCDLGAGGVVEVDGLDTLVSLSRPYREVDRVVLAMPGGAPAAQDPSAFGGVAVGVETGSVAAPAAALLPGAVVEEYPSRRDLARALRNGDVAAAVVAPADVPDVRRTAADAGVVLRLGTGQHTVLVLPQGPDPEIAAAVDAALVTLMEAPSHAALLERWIDG